MWQYHHSLSSLACKIKTFSRVDSIKIRLVGSRFWPKLCKSYVSWEQKKLRRISEYIHMTIFTHVNFSGLFWLGSACDTLQYRLEHWFLTIMIWISDKEFFSSLVSKQLTFSSLQLIAADQPRLELPLLCPAIPISCNWSIS